MKNHKLLKKLIALVISLSLIITAIVPVSAFDTSYISEDGMKLGYSIINGYSKLSARKGNTTYETSAIYSGLDVTNPYVITLVGIFYFTNGVDIEKASSDNEYTMNTIAKLDTFLQKMGVKNNRAVPLKQQLADNAVTFVESFDTAGLYIVKGNKEYLESLSDDSNVDFVLSGGEMPTSMKDLNLDGKSDDTDAVLIQKYLADALVYDDDDINEYLKFACDIDGDKEINITDATALQKQDN